MEASRKRKAPSATPTTTDGSASKKLKLLNSHAAPASKTHVQEVGEKIVEALRNAKDKNGRLIATEFLTLPDRDAIPEYYEATKLPLALDTIEGKLKRNEYPTVTTIESDLKRLVQNAKDYNDPNSVIYDDAEKIRKNVSNFMKQHNPAYKVEGYSAFATPIPNARATVKLLNGATDQSESTDKPKRPAVSRVSEQPDRKASVAPSATTGDAEVDGDAYDDEDGAGGVDIDLTGKTFQEAQQMILSHLLHYTDEEGLEIYSPFGNLPTRKLEDYYKIIKHPVCIKSVAKRARGQHGRAPPTGVSDFKNWDAFEEEVSFIWRNAHEYNEDGSAMYILASDFEEHFKNLLTEAKEKVDEPSGPRIKIGGPKPKVMLNLSQHRGSPAPGVTVDNEALARQKEMVQAGVNGQQTSQQSQPGAPTVNGLGRQSSSGVAGVPLRPSSSTHSGSPQGIAVKPEKMATQSPVGTNVSLATQSLTNGMMPPPVLRPSSSSPFPLQSSINSFHYTAPALLPPTQIRSYSKDAALLPNVTINTHPQLKIPKAFSMTVTPHATLSHQSTTTTLPSTHYFLQISPTISKQLSMGRPYKIFVTVNGTRLTQRDTQFHANTGKRTHVYEGSLAQGVNRVEVEVAAAKQGDEKGLDVEKVTVFANLMR